MIGEDEIVLQFVTESDPLSAAIRYFSHSVVSHVDLVLPDGGLLGARMAGGVQVRGADYAPWSMVLRATLRSPCAPKVYAAALSQLGKPYDWRAILAFAVDRDWREADSWICSELQAWALEQGGFFQRPLYLGVNKITPGDLLLVVSPFAEIARVARP